MRTWQQKLDGYFIAFCRRAFGWSHFKKEALKKAEIRKGVWRCKLCGKETTKPIVDHTQPVVPTSGPWDRDWVKFRDRLFTDQLQILDKRCHDFKSKAENAERKKNRGGIGEQTNKASN